MVEYITDKDTAEENFQDTRGEYWDLNEDGNEKNECKEESREKYEDCLENYEDCPEKCEEEEVASDRDSSAAESSSCTSDYESVNRYCFFVQIKSDRLKNSNYYDCFFTVIADSLIITLKNFFYNSNR